MFRIKPTITATVVAIFSKPDNVLVNVIIAVTTRNQVPKQHVRRKCKPMKAKVIVDWQTK
jgi:hypothetical protein